MRRRDLRVQRLRGRGSAHERQNYGCEESCCAFLNHLANTILIGQTRRRIPLDSSVDDRLRAHDGLRVLIDDDALEPMLLALAHADD